MRPSASAAPWLSLACLAAVLPACGAEAAPAPAAAPAASATPAAYESPGAADAAAVLGARARGPHHEVLSPVASDGFLFTWRIRSDFGQFEVEGNQLLAMRLREIDALASLSELSKSEVFKDAVAAGVRGATLGQVETLQAFAQHPVETVKGVPQGVSRMLRKYKGVATEAAHDVKETTGGEGDGGSVTETAKKASDQAADAARSYAGKYLGTSAAERRWAQKLKVDPYTSNEVLRKQIAAVARVDAAGRFGVRYAGIPSIPGIGEVRDLEKLVWETDPAELRTKNRETLLQLGVSEDILAAFQDNPWLSPTLQTFVVAGIGELDGVADRHRLIGLAAEVDSEAGAWFLASGLRLLAKSHKERTPLAAIVDSPAAPTARARNGRTVVALAVDRIFWTQTLDEGLARLRSTVPAASRIELLTPASLTPRSRSELAQRGVDVVAMEALTAEPAPKEGAQ